MEFLFQYHANSIKTIARFILCSSEHGGRNGRLFREYVEKGERVCLLLLGRTSSTITERHPHSPLRVRCSNVQYSVFLIFIFKLPKAFDEFKELCL